jgi:hypothetical protein
MSQKLKKLAHDILTVMGFKKNNEEPKIQEEAAEEDNNSERVGATVQKATAVQEEESGEICTSSSAGLDEESEAYEAGMDDEPEETNHPES